MHLFDSEVIDEVVVVFVEAAVQGHTVRVEEQVLQGIDPLQPQSSLNTVQQVGVVEDHVKAKGFSSQSYRLAYAA